MDRSGFYDGRPDPGDVLEAFGENGCDVDPVLNRLLQTAQLGDGNGPLEL